MEAALQLPDIFDVLFIGYPSTEQKHTFPPSCSRDVSQSVARENQTMNGTYGVSDGVDAVCFQSLSKGGLVLYKSSAVCKYLLED